MSVLTILITDEALANDLGQAQTVCHGDQVIGVVQQHLEEVTEMAEHYGEWVTLTRPRSRPIYTSMTSFRGHRHSRRKPPHLCLRNTPGGNIWIRCVRPGCYLLRVSTGSYVWVKLTVHQLIRRKLEVWKILQKRPRAAVMHLLRA
jgi:hypothetical protein